MKKSSIKDLTLTSVLAAIILVLIFVPYIGFIPLGVLSLTIIHIPVLIGVFLLPKRYAIFLGLIFGLGSWIRAIILPQTILDPAFQNPLVSVVPRIIFAIVAAFLFDLFKWIERKMKDSDLWFYGIISLSTAFIIFYSFRAISEQASWNFNNIVPFALIFIAGLITLYYAFIQKKKKNEIIYPSLFLLSTMFHTIIVLICLVIFEKQFLIEVLLIEDFFGAIMYVALTNGVLESLLAAVVGTPIILRLLEIKENK
jgi:uncharacterized membrane protein